MYKRALPPAQVQPTSVLDLTPGMVIPIVITAIICTSVVLIVYFLLRDTKSHHRADLVRAWAEVVRATAEPVRASGDAVRKILEVIFHDGPGRFL